MKKSPKCYKCADCGRTFAQPTPHICKNKCFKKHHLNFINMEDSEKNMTNVFEFISKIVDAHEYARENRKEIAVPEEHATYQAEAFSDGFVEGWEAASRMITKYVLKYLASRNA